jgi:aryl-alcohol dehydrogenase-like predicted oxidoreductase
MAQNTAATRVGLGNSDLSVYPFGLGGNTFGTRTDQRESERVLDAFVANGGNLIDTADMYSYWAPGASGGESEETIGKWMSDRGVRDQVVIVTKVGGMPSRMGLARENVEAALDDSLRRLQTDYVDLYFAHYDDESLPVEDYARTFDKFVRDGKVRFIGASNFSPARISEWLRIAEENDLAAPVALQPNYSLVSRQTYESQYAPLAESHKLGVMTYSSLASGFLSGKYRTAADLEGAPRGGAVEGYLNEDGLRVIEALGEVASSHGAAMSTVALAWLLAHPTVSAPLASATSPEQLDELMASTTLELTEAEIADLEVASRAFA